MKGFFVSVDLVAEETVPYPGAEEVHSDLAHILKENSIPFRSKLVFIVPDSVQTLSIDYLGRK